MVRKKVVIGLTGNIASGKSSVGSILSSHGFSIIEADRIGWELLKEPEIAEKIISVFGDVRTEGTIDRKKLGEAVFSDKARLETLNSIIHPPLLDELKTQIERSSEDIVIVSAALIMEWGIEEWFDKIILVTCDTERKIERLEKKGMGREQVLQRLQSQIPEAEKVPKSDFIIENNGTLDELRAKTLKLMERLKKLGGTEK